MEIGLQQISAVMLSDDKFTEEIVSFLDVKPMSAVCIKKLPIQLIQAASTLAVAEAV